MSDLDIRIAALQAEYNTQLSIISNRSATFAAELASTQARLKVAEERITEVESKAPPKKTRAKSDG